MKRREFEKISKNVILICDDVFPLYIIRGEQNYLVDCAITAKAEEFSAKISKILGEEDGFVSRKIDGVLLTHTHYDHMGICSFLEDRYGFEIIASSVGVNLLKKQKVIDFINYLNDGFCRLLNVQTDVRVKKPENLRSVSEGDTLKIDAGNELKVFETPGHTRCSLSYYLLPDKIMFPGDTIGVVEKNGSIKPLFLSSYKSYIDSLNKLKAQAIEVMCFAHNRVIRGEERIERFLEKAVQSARNLKKLILDKLNSSHQYNHESLAREILDEQFTLPTVMGPEEALMINVIAMIKVIIREFQEQIPNYYKSL
jgi:glyoxylase-like metal-dependent hydrolase (beta-lactamase superfamily II)